MDKNMFKRGLLKASQIMVLVTGFGVVFWIVLALAHIFTFYYFFSTTSNVLQDYNVSEFAAKAIATVFAAIVAWWAGSIVVDLFKRNRRWIPVLAGLMALWYGIMFVVASPYEASPFNIFNGKAGKYYRDQYNRIHTMPRGAKIGPNGEPVYRFDSPSAQEYQRQRGRKSSYKVPGIFDRMFGSTVEGGLYMQIERIETTPQSTVLHFAVNRADNYTPGRFYQPQESYLTDEYGQSYDMTRDNAEYPNYVDAETHKNELSTGKHADTHIIRADETYRFTAEYPALRPDTQRLRLHDSRFEEVDLDYQVKLARVQQQIQENEARETQSRWEAQQRADEAAREVQLRADAEARAQAEREIAAETEIQKWTVERKEAQAEAQRQREAVEQRQLQIDRQKAAEAERQRQIAAADQTRLNRQRAAEQAQIDRLRAAEQARAEQTARLRRGLSPLSDGRTTITTGTTVAIGRAAPTVGRTPPPSRSFSNPAATSSTRSITFSQYCPVVGSPVWFTPQVSGRPQIMVDFILTKDSQTMVSLCARIDRELRVGNLSNPQRFGTYLMDESGRTYQSKSGRGKMLRVTTTGPGYETFAPRSGLSYGDGTELEPNEYVLNAGQVYMFGMYFDPIPGDVRELTLYRRDYPPIKLDRQLNEMRSR